MLPAVLASLAYRCSQVECSGWLSTIDARFNANLNGVYALQAGSSPFPGHTLENVVNQGQIKTLFLYPIDDPDYGKLWCIGDSDGSLNVKAYIIADGREPFKTLINHLVHDDPTARARVFNLVVALGVVVVVEDVRDEWVVGGELLGREGAQLVDELTDGVETLLFANLRQVLIALVGIKADDKHPYL